MHVDGGGARVTKHGMAPASWAVTVTTEADDGTFSFSHYAGGDVATDTEAFNFLGAETADSMTAEITAQLYAAVMVLADTAHIGRSVPI